jgi:hypothetical protein
MIQFSRRSRLASTFLATTTPTHLRFTSYPNGASSRKVDAAIVWGPAAGYFAARESIPLELVPVPSGKTDLPFAFDISMGVRKGDEALKVQLEQVLDKKQIEIEKILKDYGVPLMDRKTAIK